MAKKLTKEKPKAAAKKKVAAPKKVKAAPAKKVKAAAPKKTKAVAKKVAAPKKAKAAPKKTKTAAAKKAHPVKKKEEGLELVDLIIKGMQEKKAHDIAYFDLRELPNAVCDFFVVCHGNSNTQVGAIADSVEEIVRVALREKPWHTEGFQNAQWILMDYVNVVVHVFQKEYREFYRIEDLWADAEIHTIESDN